ncbi:MAG: hypothetical protein EOP84_19260 [Verrucomicrobiaceae bacterium]|nr:MAG: hypothetical protein EOP84_19260 [Verrucomicrobiaceae bacterium]
MHNRSAAMDVVAIEVKQGDAIDFVVDFREGLNSDMFTWAPVITAIQATSAPDLADSRWEAHQQFGGSMTEPIVPLTPLEQYAQVLLLSNEFSFVD